MASRSLEIEALVKVGTRDLSVARALGAVPVVSLEEESDLRRAKDEAVTAGDGTGLD